MQSLFDAESAEVRRWAIYLLAEARDLESVPRIRAALASTNPRERQNAVEAAATLGDHKAVPQITQLIDDADFGVWQAALQSLVSLRARESIPAIQARQAVVMDDDARKDYSTALLALRNGSDWPAH